MKRTIIAAAAALFAATPAFTPALAQSDYPTGSVRLIVPFAPGGGTDSLGRIFADVLSHRLGKTVVVENMAGAGGTIGASAVAHAKPDGYMLTTGTPSLTINPFIQKDISYDPAKDFAPVALLADSPMVLVVPPKSSFKTVQDVIDAAKANPGKVLYGSAGVGSIDHLSSALFASMAHVQMTHVPYRGAAPALTDLIGGALTFMFENAPSVIGDVHSGQLRAIAVSTAKPSTLLPGLPTVTATVPGYESSSWFGILAPAKTPAAIVNKLNAALNAGLKDPDTQKKLDALGVERIGGSPADFTAYLTRNIAAMKAAAAAANLTPQ